MRELLWLIFVSACAGRSTPQIASAQPTAAGPSPVVATSGNTSATAHPPPAAPPSLGQFLPQMLAGLTRKSFGQYEPKVFPDIFPAKIVSLYNDCGVLNAADADYDKEHVILIDSGIAINALCVFGYEKTLDAKPIDEAKAPQGEGYRRPGHTFARRGRYYLRVVGSNQSSGGGKNALALTQAILDELPNPTEPDPQLEKLRALPMIGRIPGSDHYIPYGVFGLTTLPRGFSADYGCGDAGLSIAHLGLPPGVNAAQLLGRALKEALTQGYTQQVYHLHENAVRLDKSGKPTVYLVQVGESAAAIEADGELTSCEHIPRELVRVLE